MVCESNKVSTQYSCQMKYREMNCSKEKALSSFQTKKSNDNSAPLNIKTMDGFSLSLFFFPKYLNENKITSSCFIFHHKTIDTNTKILISHTPHHSIRFYGYTALHFPILKPRHLTL